MKGFSELLYRRQLQVRYALILEPLYEKKNNVNYEQYLLFFKNHMQFPFLQLRHWLSGLRWFCERQTRKERDQLMRTKPRARGNGIRIKVLTKWEIHMQIMGYRFICCRVMSGFRFVMHSIVSSYRSWMHWLPFRASLHLRRHSNACASCNWK